MTQQDDDRGANRTVDTSREQHKAAQERAKAAFGTAEKGVSFLLEEAKERLGPLDAWVKTTTRDRPYTAVSTAMGVSFLAGIFMRRRTAVGIGLALGFLGGCLISGSGVKADRQPRIV